MKPLPSSVSAYLCSRFIGERPMAYFLMDEGGTVTDSGGNLDMFGMDLSGLGWDITSRLFFMVGLLPLDRPSFELSAIRLNPAVTVDAHLFQIETGYGLLLLDTTKEAKRLKRLQQKANESALLREKRKRSP